MGILRATCDVCRKVLNLPISGALESRKGAWIMFRADDDWLGIPYCVCFDCIPEHLPIIPTNDSSESDSDAALIGG